MSDKNESLPTTLQLTPSEVKARARKYFNELLESGKDPWPNKFLSSQGFHRLKCRSCGKNFWSMNPNRGDCGDSSCAGGYSFLHPNNPPEKRLTYLQAWNDFKKCMESCEPIPYTAIRRYPVVARWRSDVDFVAAGIYCFQPFCVTGESEPPANPLIACQFCLRFNDLDNIGITGRHYSGFNMLGIQVFNRSDRMRKEPLPPFDEYEEIFWKDTLIANNFRWCIDTLHLDPNGLTFIEDVWQGGGNCGACVEYFYGGLEIGNMVFTEYSVTPDCRFLPISTKVVDVGIGLERIPWLVNGGWTSYLDVFDYCLPQLSKKLGVEIDNEEFRKFAPNTALFDVDENDHVDKTWKEIASSMGLDEKGLHEFRERLQLFTDLVIVCDHTRSILYAIEDGALPSNNGGAANIRNILRRVFLIIKSRGWFEKLGGIEGVIDIFMMHTRGLEGFFGPFNNIRCLQDCIKVEWERWEASKINNAKILRTLVTKYRGKTIPIEEWFVQMESNGVSPNDIVEAVRQDDPKSAIDVPEGLWLKFNDYRHRTAKGIALEEFDVEGIPETEEIYNYPENEYVYQATSKIIKILTPQKIVLDRTIFYPTQGGQEHDDGYFMIEGKIYNVVDAEKIRKVAIFTLDGALDESFLGKEVTQFVDPEIREIMRTQHSATHVVAAAARKVLGPHVWQNGAKKTKTISHIDLTHFITPSFEEIVEINKVANEMLLTNAKVQKRIYTRKEAEDSWGFVLYQGGAIPGDKIRVVDIGGIDTEACCGTHVNSLAEIGQIRILSHNNLQDGVFRVNFVAGKLAIKAVCDDMVLLKNVSKLYDCTPNEILMNCNKFFIQRNALTSQTKNLLDQVINTEVKCCSMQDGDKFMIVRSDADGSGFIKSLEANIKLYSNLAEKSVILLGPTYMIGNIQPDVIDSMKPKIDEIIKSRGNDEKGKPICIPLIVTAAKKTVQQKKKDNAPIFPASKGIMIQSMKLDSDAVRQINNILIQFGFK